MEDIKGEIRGGWMVIDDGRGGEELSVGVSWRVLGEIDYVTGENK